MATVGHGYNKTIKNKCQIVTILKLLCTTRTDEVDIVYLLFDICYLLW